LVIPLHGVKAGKCSCGKSKCGSAGKHPRTVHGLKDASTDAEQIKAWLLRWPDANIGICTGPESGLVVLDVDGADARACLTGLIGLHSKLPETPRVLTGRVNTDGKRNGCHYYFRAPGGPAVKSGTAVLGKGLDIRAQGGYVVAPPSIHSTGRLYQWLTPGADLAELPQWMLANFSRVPAKPVSQAPPSAPRAIEEGGRNHGLASLAGTMRRRGMTQEAIEAALLIENSKNCNPPLDSSEVLAIAASVALRACIRSTSTTTRDSATINQRK
jgi:putative DNA primase/helicase